MFFPGVCMLKVTVRDVGVVDGVVHSCSGVHHKDC